MVGSTGSWVVDSASAMASDSSRMDLIVAALVERMRERSDGGVAMLLVSSFSILLPGLPGLYLLLSMRRMPVKKVVMALWVYWLLELHGSVSLVITALTGSPVVAQAVK